MKTTLINLTFMMVCLVAPISATTVNVPWDYPDIQSAIAAINCSADDQADVIIVEKGIYPGNIDLSGKKITVRSTDPLDPAVVAETIIDCGFMFGFYFEHGETAETVVDGFTITNGGGEFGGASVCLLASSPIVRNCVIRSNSNSGWEDGQGAGLYCDLGSSPVFENCDFIQNSSISGGAISIWGGNPTFTNCQFVENSASSGGAISVVGSSPVFRYCIFEKNIAGLDGGAMYLNSEFSPVIEYCQFIGNIAMTSVEISSTEQISLGWGGAISSYFGKPIVRNCLFVNNYSVLGGAINIQDAENFQIKNCTIVDNLASEQGSALNAVSTAGLILENNIFWGNVITPASTIGSAIYYSGQDEGDIATISYCALEGGKSSIRTGTGTIAYVGEPVVLDPLFVKKGFFTDTGEYVLGDWHLQKKSSCINAGNPATEILPGDEDIDGESRKMNGRVEIGVDEVEMAIAAKINIFPGKLIVPCKGFVLAMIRLPEGYAVKDIDPKSILWDGKLSARCLEKCRHNAVAVFDLAKISDLLDDVEGKVEITISGQLTDGTAFAGSDTIHVDQVYWKHWFRHVCRSVCRK